MITAKIFPTILIVLDVLAAVMYLPSGDWRHVIYWLAGAVLTFTVFIDIKRKEATHETSGI